MKLISFLRHDGRLTADGGEDTGLMVEPLESRILLSGTHYVVDSLLDVVADDGVVTLREAIEAANTNEVVFDAAAGSATEKDLITFDAALNGATILLDGMELSITESLDIEGPGAELLSINAGGRSRVFRVSGSETQALLSGLTVTFGRQTGYRNNGGGIYIDQCELTLSQSVVSDSYALDGYGGGITVRRGVLSIKDSTVTGNTSGYCGGGIHNDDGVMTLFRSRITDNYSEQCGGGINNSSFDNSSGNLSIISSLIAANYSEQCGGGISFQGGTVEVTQSTISGNVSEQDGGGIYSPHTSNVLLLNNSLVAMNTALNDPAVSGGYSQSNSIVGMDPHFVRNPSAGLDGEWGTADDDPGDLHFRDTSIAINLGDPDFAVDEDGQPLLSDLDGQARVADGRVDVGVYEYQGAISPLRETPSAEVTTLADVVDFFDGEISLREALIYGHSSDTPVTFAAALGGQTFAVGGQALSIHGSVTLDARPVGGITLDAGGLSRVMYVGGNTVAVVLSGLTITGGQTESAGGGIMVERASLSISDSVITGNHANSAGGGIYARIHSGSLNLSDVIVTGNTSNSNGGGVFSLGDARIIRSTVSNNQAGNGGGIYKELGILVINQSRIIGNRSLSPPTSSVSGGGGMYCFDATYTIINSVISNNRAESTGGGIYSIGSPDSALQLTNTTVAGNKALVSGGGIQNFGELLTLNNTIVSRNEAGQVSGDYLGDGNLIRFDPGFVRNPAAGADGIWATDDDDYGDLRLSESSVAINFGDNTLAVNGEGAVLTEDFDGQPRLVDGQVDVGAYEYQGVLSPLRETPSTQVTTAADSFNTLDGEISLREAIFYERLLNTAVTFAPELAGDTLALTQSELWIDESMTLDATSVGGITLDAGGASRVLFVSGETVELSLVGLTLTGGNTDSHGGGIYSYQATISLSNVKVTGNTSQGRGGGIYNGKGAMTLTETEVSDNVAGYSGGGIYSNYSDLILFSAKVSGNKIQSTFGNRGGGGISQFHGKVSLINSEISSNACFTYSGFSPSFGGGLVNYEGELIAVNTKIIGNSAMNGGGILHAGSYDNAGVLLINTLVMGNRGRYQGGGIDNQVGLLTLVNSEVICNSGQNGSGIYADGSTPVTLNNSIVALNDRYNIEIHYTDISGTNNLIDVDPLFVRNPDHGGDGWGDDPTTSGVDESLNDDYGDLRLQAGSPGVNGGDDGLLPPDEFDLDGDGDVAEALPVDLAGNARVIGGRVDIGAYESAHLLPQPNGDFNGDDSVGLIDLDILGRHWRMGENDGQTADLSHGDANGDGVVGLLDLDILGRTWGMGVMKLGVLPGPDRAGAVDWWEVELEEEEVVLF